MSKYSSSPTASNSNIGFAFSLIISLSCNRVPAVIQSGENETQVSEELKDVQKVGH